MSQSHAPETTLNNGQHAPMCGRPSVARCVTSPYINGSQHRYSPPQGRRAPCLAEYSTLNTTPSISLRPCRHEDIATIKAITAEAFDGVSIDQSIQQHHGMVGGHDWTWHKLRHIDHDFADGQITVAEEADGTVVGYVTMRIDREARSGSIPNLAVRADRRGRGIGRRLLEHAVATFRAEGLEIARIETLAQNSVGSHLYPEVGFEAVARQVHFAMRL